MKEKFYQILGYAGALPFLGLAILSFVLNDSRIASVQIGYAAIIASFLGGLHWPFAVKTGCPFYLSIIMLPSIIGLGCVILGLFMPTPALLIMAILFIGLSLFDKKYLKPEDWPQNYSHFRLKITVIVSTLLIITACSQII